MTMKVDLYIARRIDGMPPEWAVIDVESPGTDAVRAARAAGTTLDEAIRLFRDVIVASFHTQEEAQAHAAQLNEAAPRYAVRRVFDTRLFPAGQDGRFECVPKEELLQILDRVTGRYILHQPYALTQLEEAEEECARWNERESGIRR